MIVRNTFIQNHLVVGESMQQDASALFSVYFVLMAHSIQYIFAESVNKLSIMFIRLKNNHFGFVNILFSNLVLEIWGTGLMFANDMHICVSISSALFPQGDENKHIKRNWEHLHCTPGSSVSLL